MTQPSLYPTAAIPTNANLESVLQRKLQHPRWSGVCRGGSRVGGDQAETAGGGCACSGIARIKVIDHIEPLEANF